MNKPAILLENIYKTFIPQDGTEVETLSDINLTVEKGDFVSIVGPSGCGKSTLLNIMVGLENPTSGNVFIDGIPLLKKGFTGWAGYMTQQDALMSWRTVIENVQIGLEIHNVSKNQQKIRSIK